MFYELGFRILNKDENLELPWSKESCDQQQIDVLAVGDDAIFVVECKAADSPRNVNFKKDIDHI
ncbi:MAG: NERD domain-containing protein, partial [Paramuribaculum sp.]|nr:NERD domain-containing protein [Paramuribaculum sp.]